MQIHIIPTLASLCFFAFLVLLGRAFFALARVRMPGMAAWLLSPAMGLALLTLLVCYPNQAGFPVATYGRGLLAGLAVLAGGVLLWRRCPVPWRLLGVLSGLALLWHATAGWPLLRFGNDWVSYVNGDYTNYCIGAVRLLKHGFFASPTVEALGGGDPSGVYWFLHVAAGARPGTDLVLAAASATAGASPREAFMPVILAFGLTQAWALGGALALSSRFRKAALPATAVLLALPLFGLGIYYQLFAQVGGLALMWLVIAMLVKGEPARGWRGLLGLAATCAVAVAALFLFYPECAPFALLPPAIVLFCTLWKKNPPVWKTRLAWLVPAVAMTLVLLNRNIPLVTHYFLIQLKSGSTQETGLFPYFLNTDAWAKWLGWAPFYGTPSFRLTLFAVAVAIPLPLLLIRRCRIVAAFLCVATVFVLMAAMMWRKQSGFGLFKLAMFTQPLAAAGIAVGWLACRSRWLQAGLATAFVAIAFPAWKSYQSFAMGATGGPCEGPYVSELGFPEVPAAAGTYQAINMRPGLEKLVALSLRHMTADPVALSMSELYWGGISPVNITGNTIEEARRMVAAFKVSEAEYPPGVFHFYCAPKQNRPELANIVEPHPLLCPFNRMHAANRPADWFAIHPAAKAENHLAWQPIEFRTKQGTIGSSFMSHWNGLPVTPDPAKPAETLGVVGRHLLFSVIRPTPQVYVRVAFTRSYSGQGKVQLATQAMLKGGEDIHLGFTGSGSANVIVGPITPHADKGRALVFLDLGAPPRQLDAGNLVESNGLLRDVSALSPESYQSLKRPNGLSRFPNDLIGDPGLEYSGIYEDGWIDKASWLVLGTPKGRQSELRIRGRMDAFRGLEAGNNLSVSIDGTRIRLFEIAPGEFDVSLPVPPQASEAVKIGLEWTKSASLPPGDDRPVAAWIRSIQLQPL